MTGSTPDDRIKRMAPGQADPIGIDIDDKGHLFYTRTNRQKNSEFDIRGHQNWAIPSIALQTVGDKRAFLRKVLSPENSAKNECA